MLEKIPRDFGISSPQGRLSLKLEYCLKVNQSISIFQNPCFSNKNKVLQFSWSLNTPHIVKTYCNYAQDWKSMQINYHSGQQSLHRCRSLFGVFAHFTASVFCFMRLVLTFLTLADFRGSRRDEHMRKTIFHNTEIFSTATSFLLVYQSKPT